MSEDEQCAIPDPLTEEKGQIPIDGGTVDSTGVVDPFDKEDNIEPEMSPTPLKGQKEKADMVTVAEKSVSEATDVE